MYSSIISKYQHSNQGHESAVGITTRTKACRTAIARKNQTVMLCQLDSVNQIRQTMKECEGNGIVQIVMQEKEAKIFNDSWY